MSKLRSVMRVVFAAEKPEGIGATVRRSIGIRSNRYFSPFLLLDHFTSAASGGFPDHPHRGQETITLMVKNYMLHEDFTGKSGVLRPGDLQFMTAGRGIMHAEMPYSLDGTSIEGIQLWVDLPNAIKHTKPRYRDLRAEEIPIARPQQSVEVSVISGESNGVKSQHDLAYTPIEFYSVKVKPGGVYEQKIATDFNAFVYILNGDLVVNNVRTNAHHCVLLKPDGDSIKCEVPLDSSSQSMFVVIAGKTMEQSVVQMGPFVESTKESAYKAFDDYENKTNGFEQGLDWKSGILGGVSKSLFQKKVEENLTKRGISLVPHKNLQS